MAFLDSMEDAYVGVHGVGKLVGRESYLIDQGDCPWGTLLFNTKVNLLLKFLERIVYFDGRIHCWW